MICLDANIVIEIMLERASADNCRRYIQATSEDLALTLLSVDLVMYYAERQKLDLVTVQDFLKSFHWLPMTEHDADWAFGHYRGRDYEDALQVGCALREDCSRFATLDRQLAKKYDGRLPIDCLLP